VTVHIAGVTFGGGLINRKWNLRSIRNKGQVCLTAPALRPLIILRCYTGYSPSFFPSSQDLTFDG